jgi:Uma2 family endonuclease
MYDFRPPKPSRERLPTMYDLPSEDPEEPGLPDEFHPVQSQLLRETFHSPVIPNDRYFIGTDINLYYDSRHTQWYKRPDWFLVTDVASSATVEEMRWSYVIWQESVTPFLVVELLSEGTEAEDLGQTLRVIDKPPTKWEVYEQILRVPFYVVFDRCVRQMRVFRLEGARYQEMNLSEPKLWLAELQLGLGVWDGIYEGTEGQWLCWYDRNGDWIPTNRAREIQTNLAIEQANLAAEAARSQAEAVQMKADRLAARLRSLGVDPDTI